MNNITKEEIDRRVARGVELFKSGLNCSQAVVGAFCDLYNIPEDVALRMSASFGGGTARMRLTCGTANGMFMLAGLENGCTTAADPQIRAKNYALVQDLAKKFKEVNGTLSCAELLGLRAGKTEIPLPGNRTAEYYKSRPCPKIVESACRIFGDYLLSRE